MYSPWAFSRLAVPLLITRKPVTSTAPLFDEASLVTAFKEAGYRTAWVSLKPALGFNASPVSIHAFEADRPEFLAAAYAHKSKINDLVALDAVAKILREEEGDLLIVIHTLGSHFSYADRYHHQLAQFFPDVPADGTPTRLFSASHSEYLSNAYDNSLLVMDQLVDGLITQLEALPDTESFLYFSSDHGEALFDDCRGYSGHGHVNYHTQTVASLFWASDGIMQRHAEKLLNMQANRTRGLDIGSTFATMIDLAEITIPGWTPSSALTRADLPESPIALQAERDRDHACPASFSVAG